MPYINVNVKCVLMRINLRKWINKQTHTYTHAYILACIHTLKTKNRGEKTSLKQKGSDPNSHPARIHIDITASKRKRASRDKQTGDQGLWGPVSEDLISLIHSPQLRRKPPAAKSFTAAPGIPTKETWGHFPTFSTHIRFWNSRHHKSRYRQGNEVRD